VLFEECYRDSARCGRAPRRIHSQQSAYRYRHLVVELRLGHHPRPIPAERSSRAASLEWRRDPRRATHRPGSVVTAVSRRSGRLASARSASQLVHRRAWPPARSRSIAAERTGCAHQPGINHPEVGAPLRRASTTASQSRWCPSYAGSRRSIAVAIARRHALTNPYQRVSRLGAAADLDTPRPGWLW